MSKIAFFLIETDKEKTTEIVNLINRIDGIKSANRVAPPYNSYYYDIITMVETENLNDMGTVALKIESLSGVYRCATCIVTETSALDVFGQSSNALAIMRS
jgi:hypothetical protein